MDATGLQFQPGDPEALARQVEWALEHPAELKHMRKEARVEFEENYTSEKNYSQLVAIYDQAIERSKQSG